MQPVLSCCLLTAFTTATGYKHQHTLHDVQAERKVVQNARSQVKLAQLSEEGVLAGEWCHCYAMLCCAMLCLAVPCCAVLGHAMLSCAVLCRAGLVPCCAVLCCAAGLGLDRTLPHAVLFCALLGLCHAVLCHTVLRCAAGLERDRMLPQADSISLRLIALPALTGYSYLCHALNLPSSVWHICRWDTGLG